MSISIIKYPVAATAGTVTGADNGLSVSSNIVQLGQTVSEIGDPASLTTNREIPTNGFNLLFTGTGRVAINTTTPNSTHKFTSIATGTDRAVQATSVNNTTINAASSGSGTAIMGQTTGTGVAAVYGSNQGTSGYGVYAVAGINGGIPFKASGFSTANNSSAPIIAEFVRSASGGTAVDGIGGTIMFRSQTTTTAETESGQIRNYFSTALHGSRSSNFEFHLVNNTISARKALLASTGKLTLDAYGSGTFTGTPIHNLQVDSTGNIIEGDLIAIGAITTETVVSDTTITVNINGTNYKLLAVPV